MKKSINSLLIIILMSAAGCVGEFSSEPGIENNSNQSEALEKNPGKPETLTQNNVVEFVNKTESEYKRNETLSKYDDVRYTKFRFENSPSVTQTENGFILKGDAFYSAAGANWVSDEEYVVGYFINESTLLRVAAEGQSKQSLRPQKNGTSV